MSVNSPVIRVVFAFTICYLLSIVTIEAGDINDNGEISELRQLITDIQKRQRFYEHELLSQQTIIKDQANEIAKLKDLFHGSGTINVNHNESVHHVTHQSTNIPNALRNNINRRQLQGGGIAFSVYLDHDLDLGAPEVLKYNKIITNEGGGYNLNTGAFICPESGMYLLSFYIGERGGLSPQGAYIYLKVNNVNIIDAVVDAPHYTQDLQGGNTVIIRLKAGDVVITQHEDSGGHVEAEKEKDCFALNQMITEILDKQRIHEANIVLQQKQMENQANQIAELQELQRVIKNKVNQTFELEELRKVIKDQANQKAEFQELRKVIKDQANQKTELAELRKFIKDQAIQKTELEELRKVIKDQAIEIGNLKNMQKDHDNEKTKIKAGTDINQKVKNSQSMQHEHIANYIPKDEKEQAGRVLHVNDSVQKTNQSLNHTSILRNKLNRRLLQAGSGGIAFSVYLDHDVNFGAHQVLKYNRIITNEGNGYSVHTGSFTCPESGIYLLSFSIGQRGDTVARGAYIYLMVNSVNVIDAVVDSFHNTQDLQGGNTVIIRLKAGDVVFTEGDEGSHGEGSTGVRLTSFSGVLLYP
ncbi:C1QL [Mytilus coruscus]|uniref:C1QL n=1 Tax=Mytilus coruscus TaxID=42192 RepID=A0A6J8EB38_MYTCO|nr:C1QL [Mytilus coruscus]